ncbi:MAG: isocitrate lyase/phosphoenolpyruvate mutase family protein [Pseudomonadota bacterium]
MTLQVPASAAARLRGLLARRAGVAAPGCHDALGALLIAEAGFEAVSLSGYSVAASAGRPDIGLISGTQMAAAAAALVEATPLPVIADADTGYGGIANIAETVRAYERGGVAALHLEDQQNPKRCGAMASKSLVGEGEMAQRLRAALAARREMLVIGRTDAMSLHGLPEVIRRCRVMADAGVDAVMVPSLSSLADIDAVVKASPVPVVHTVAETVRPLFTQAQLAATGLGLVMYSITLIQACVQLQRRILATLRSDGTTVPFVDAMIPLAQLTALLGAERHAAFENRILASEG